ncbi:hypothetical protein G9A89_003069 [Geosiphon pyriformis]|nr:hypothetical protein G9A89_003069 [Geosiphon pyriformis]
MSTRIDIDLRRQELVKNLGTVKQRIHSALEGKGEARLVAVSKFKHRSDIFYAYEAGQRHFGENYVQELVEKSKELPSDIKWHFIGSFQSNKCKILAAIPNLWAVETIDSAKNADALNKACASRESSLKVFVQVNTSGDKTKSGVEEEQCIPILQHIREKCDKLELIGIMTIGVLGHVSVVDGPNPAFIKLVKIYARAKEVLGIDLELSMGMSGDFEEALKLGSTNIRIGSTIFGERRPKKTL